MRGKAKNLVGIHRYQAERPVQTQAKLMEALKRMETGSTLVVEAGFSWSKTTLAREASVNINTVVKKLPNGEWAFPKVNHSFEHLKQKRLRTTGVSAIGEVRDADLLREVKDLREQNRRLTLEVNRLGRLILHERDRADRMAVYEKQNISLREEIGRNYGRDPRRRGSGKRQWPWPT
ncbi:MAG: hypothetical protein BGO25_04695 [Acidobacteriales bacterium 59-55]|nr:hypothetical protein [Terriglobales bacterium]OJV44671.1 MAG: hypothetical protein BGO25_04695 [Acidobacteriales bacterium 59-55]